MVSDAERRGELRAAVNAQIEEVAQSLGQPESAVWEFLCECGEPACHERITLTLGDYEQLRDHSVAIVARGHRLPESVAARRRADELRSDAQALREQARVQRARARRNLEGGPQENDTE